MSGSKTCLTAIVFLMMATASGCGSIHSGPRSGDDAEGSGIGDVGGDGSVADATPGDTGGADAGDTGAADAPDTDSLDGSGDDLSDADLGPDVVEDAPEDSGPDEEDLTDLDADFDLSDEDGGLDPAHEDYVAFLNELSEPLCDYLVVCGIYPDTSVCETLFALYVEGAESCDPLFELYQAKKSELDTCFDSPPDECVGEGADLGAFCSAMEGVSTDDLLALCPGGSDPQCSDPVGAIEVGDSISGELDETSAVGGPRSAAYDTYVLHVPVTGTIRVSLASTDFDAYLSVTSLSCVALGSDDDSGGGTSGTDAQLDLPLDSGLYYVIATGFDSSAFGDYTLSVQAAE